MPSRVVHGVNSEAMRVRVKFFSSFSNLAGTNEVELEVPEGTTLGGIIEEVLRRYPQLRQFAEFMNTSVNNRVADRNTPLKEGDKVGVFPPLGGG